jgi:hypothetical protein
MTLARKGTRKIVVDGREYRWKLFPLDEGLKVVVALANSASRPVATLVDHDTLVTPRVVAEMIRAHLSDGWAEIWDTP